MVNKRGQSLMEFVAVCLALLAIGALLVVKLAPQGKNPGGITALDANAIKSIANDTN